MLQIAMWLRTMQYLHTDGSVSGKKWVNSDASSYCSFWSELIDILLDKALTIIIKIVQIIHWWYR